MRSNDILHRWRAASRLVLISHCGLFLNVLLGITGGYGGDRRVEYIIPKERVIEGSHEFVIESSCNGMFGIPWNGDTIQPPDVRLSQSLSVSSG